MAIFAICRLSDGLVVNTVIASDGDSSPIADCKMIKIPEGKQCSIGYFWDGENFIDPFAEGEGSINGV